MSRITKIALLIISLLIPNMGLSETNFEPQVKVVSDLEIERYLGKWYELARIPNRFEQNCVGVTAEYSSISDEKISVVNTCYKNTLDGKKKVAKGIARIIDNGKLKVSFIQIPILSQLASGDYWILYVNENYSVAVVGEPKRKFGWILSRSPSLSDKSIKKAFDALEINGYNTKDFELVLQNTNMSLEK